MSASERPEEDAGEGPDEDEDVRRPRTPAGGGHEVPLFLRGGNDGHKGDAQDEKDEVGE